MTLDNVKKQYAHFCKLVKGEFNERDFDRTSGTNESENEEGITIQGKMTPKRKELIKSNALRHKEDIERKYPELKENNLKPTEDEGLVFKSPDKPKPKEKK